MIRKTQFLFALTWLSMASFAQQVKPDFVKKIKVNLYDIGYSRPIEYPKTIAETVAKADAGDDQSQNLLGILYAQGLEGIDKNEGKAFDYIQKAAQQGNQEALLNLGNFYSYGTGCGVDYNKALEMFTAASKKGNDWATYRLGYMSYKGFAVPQDYEKAISYFLKSNYPMAKVFLGYCYYFGYGVAKDEDKAIVYFGKCYASNGRVVLNSIAKDAKVKMENKVNDQINIVETQDNDAIAKESIEKFNSEVNTINKEVRKTVNPKHLNGKWKGKLVQLDWSGKQIERVLPVALEFKETNGKIKYKFTVNNKTNEAEGIWQDNTLYFKALKINIETPFSSWENQETMDWQLLSATVQFKTVNKKTYLTANVDTYSDDWKEHGQPTRLILKPAAGAGEDNFTVEQLVALTDQADQFIVLYPNPFVDDLVIEYELDKDAQVSVQVYDYIHNATKVFEKTTTMQTKGKHKYNVNGAGLARGLYVVRVTTDNQVHTRIVMKN